MWSRCLRVELLSLALAFVATLGHAADSAELLARLGVKKGICIVVTSRASDLPLEFGSQQRTDHLCSVEQFGSSLVAPARGCRAWSTWDADLRRARPGDATPSRR